MILSVTLSKPAKNIQEMLGKEYEKIKIKIKNSADGFSYFAEMFTKTQVFHKHFTEKELQVFLLENEGKSTTAANIALALAEEGARVLLVDGDLRKPSLYKVLNLQEEDFLSLSDCLEKGGEISLLPVTVPMMGASGLGMILTALFGKKRKSRKSK